VSYTRILHDLSDDEQREVFFTLVRLIGFRMANSSFRSSLPLTLDEMINGFPDNIQTIAESVVELMEVGRLLLRTTGSNPPTFRINPNSATDIFRMLPS
jgi:hypothetical protein